MSLNGKEYNKIVIFGGHWKYDPGCISNGIVERDWNWKIASEVVKRLIKLSTNCQYILGINNDLYKKIKWLNKIDNVKFAMEIHLNCSILSEPQGTEVLYYNNSKLGKKYANYLYKSILKSLKWQNNKEKQRGIKSMKELGRHLGFLIHTKMPAIITESLFISNENDRNYLLQPQTFEKIVAGHINGIKKICNSF